MLCSDSVENQKAQQTEQCYPQILLIFLDILMQVTKLSLEDMIIRAFYFLS